MAFKTFDKDGSGKININEIKAIFDYTNDDSKDEVFRKMIEEADANGDGEISLEEFTAMMNKFFN